MKPKDGITGSEDRIKKLVRLAMQKAVVDPKGQRAFQLIEFYRKECQFEMNLIGIRITWLLAVQAFLVTGSVFALVNSLGGTGSVGGCLALLVCCICVIGGVISHRTLDAVDRAKCTIDIWHQRLKDIFELGQELKEPPEWIALILGRWTDLDDPYHQESLRLSNIVLPKVFIIFWIILFCSSGALAVRHFTLHSR